jgi:hypothetical protein
MARDEHVITGTGCFIEQTFDYGDDDAGAIYIRDRFGEICMWSMDEIKTEPSLVGPILNTVCLSFQAGPHELRQIVGRSCPTCTPDKPKRDHCICGGPDYDFDNDEEETEGEDGSSLA